MVWPTLEMAQAHYSDLSKKPFYTSLCVFFSSGPMLVDKCSDANVFSPMLLSHLPSRRYSVCMCWEGKDVIKQGRQMLGETQPLHSTPGSIRGDYSIDLGRNICHGSDSHLAAKEELLMWFPEVCYEVRRLFGREL